MPWIDTIEYDKASGDLLREYDAGLRRAERSTTS